MGRVLPLRPDPLDPPPRGRPPRPRLVPAPREPGGVLMSLLDGWAVDDWGRDHTLVRAASWITRRRWDVEVNGADLLPGSGPAMIVANTRRFALTPWALALMVGHEIGRPVRFVGRPDIAPVGPLARRLGGLLDRVDEVTGALRAGQIVLVGADGVFDPRRVGVVDHRLVGAAVSVGAPVFPAAASISVTGRNARVDIIPVGRPPLRRRGPLAELELTDRVRADVIRILAEFGG
ncbi:hypothetical protein BH24ACT5_BH24ACT5_06890 [soil metagenome]